MTKVFLVVGDIGGTNSRLGVVQKLGDLPRNIRRFRNAEHPNFARLLADYSAAIGITSIDGLCLAVAGVASGGRVELTNHAWTIDHKELRQATGARWVHFINDLQALGLSLTHGASPLSQHIAGPKPLSEFAPRLVVGVGTGFNAALVTQSHASATCVVHAAECGHMTLAVESEEELRLRDFLARGRGRASNERALSGMGLVELYQWTAREAGSLPADLAAAEIAQGAVADTDPICRKAASTLLRLLARTSGDLALAFMPTGGLYFAGSVARALAPLMKSVGFHANFCAKGRQSGLMQTFPLLLMPDDNAALLGCVVHAQGHHSLEPMT